MSQTIKKRGSPEGPRSGPLGQSAEDKRVANKEEPKDTKAVRQGQAPSASRTKKSPKTSRPSAKDKQAKAKATNTQANQSSEAALHNEMDRIARPNARTQRLETSPQPPMSEAAEGPPNGRQRTKQNRPKVPCPPGWRRIRQSKSAGFQRARARVLWASPARTSASRKTKSPETSKGRG